ncbi:MULTISPECIES: dihydroxyacetone kinase subunit DhaL [unclassified Mesorhizobium]|uniref:dihydroxyacetone kinase subunit DhaL n=1 Tax=unclassified Mesorhizobium TaxID=325217 RepID=UPI000FCCD6AE|nr:MULTISPECIES: dihydroxyacetone kinase subunit DhaL [unclassified Mesorhizobium]RUT82184.1 dihydroxyacetone kinase subunit L [Mesorhizobium sp. M7A.T.Ca.US.000.02.2.1]RUT83199.1 dihydroxyacetone kinase subunit L [Mesorhizobium sp. M7A.T.Ca.US.000.02.1.1]RUU05564.1 dihydroxyacetone kinase subunit L [Mesorhizobium sp. M7A.T.Ca.TU.009.02.1.1]RUU68009.1 dihydroxyacetone kinase subunit L [Mesorhizobium sp. M7A.T.Ca.TU.009.01.1.1]
MSDNAARRLSRMFYRISIAIEAGKDHLSDLDGAIGDADHGITMSLGFLAVNAELAKLDLDHMLASEIFSAAASAFLDAVGASTGPLYATAFRRAAQALKQDERLSAAGQAAIIEAITTGIKERGKGQRGDKTMLDAWIPATEAAVNACARAAGSREMWNSILQAAEAGANSTRSMVAARGRAARLGERSLGHMDPGAASAVIILRAMKDTFGGDGAK